MASASSTTPSQKFTYDVFLNFNMDDTAKHFVDHLSDHLRKKRIHTFKGFNQLRIGESIAMGVLQRIRESRVAIVIFSKKYASSRGVLDEVAEIMQCKQEFGQFVLPVFYDVEPSVVRHQTECFAESFKYHENFLEHDMEKIERWSRALEEAANIRGPVLQYDFNGNELACIKIVVDEVLNKIQLLPTFQNVASTFSVTDSQSTREWTYDVFLSFISNDTSKRFVDHLHYHLKEKGFFTFKENQKKNVEQAIQQSRAAIVIFSMNYASSPWCLDEVAAIMKCKQELGQFVVPIFYDVKYFDVYNQTGIFGDSFEEHKRMFKDDRILRWREALTKIASIKGRDLNDDYNGNESTCIKSVVDDMYKQLFQARGSFLGSIMNWQKGQVLGSGSFGKVYECITDDGGFFAVKEVSLVVPGEKGQESIYQLEQEISLLSQFEHENIVRYLGTDKDESNLYIFLELVPKGSLVSLYRNCKYQLDDKQVCAYTRQIVSGLHYLHSRGVVHRDIKCANILVHVNGSVKLADFGLAKVTKLNDDIKSCKGTPFWMAPEVVKGKSYGCSADIWSLGCTVLEMLTRKTPYSGLEWAAALFRIGRGKLPDIPEDLSEYAKDFIRKCLQLEPTDRPTAVDLLHHPFLRTPSHTHVPSTSGQVVKYNYEISLVCDVEEYNIMCLPA